MALHIRVRLFGDLERHLGKSGQTLALELPDFATVGDLLARLGPMGAEVWRVSIGGEPATPDRELADGDSVFLFPPIGGGAQDLANGSSEGADYEDRRIGGWKSRDCGWRE